MQDNYLKQVIKPGDDFSSIAAQVNRSSWNNTKAIRIEATSTHFRTVVSYEFSTGAWQTLANGGRILTASDGAGGKPQFAAFLIDHNAYAMLGSEIICMTAEDIARYGGFPYTMLSAQIDCRRLDKHNQGAAIALLNGYAAGLERANLANITGETAIMNSISAFCRTISPAQFIYTHSGVCAGLYHPSLAFRKDLIRPGMPIVAFHERGYRCNGGTKLMELVLTKWGPKAEKAMRNPEARDFVWKLVESSVSYSAFLAKMADWNPDGSIGTPIVKIYSAAHITGGGIWSKLPEALPRGVGATLNSMPKPPEVLLQAQRISQEIDRPMNDYACHSTFHGGCGMLLIVGKRYPEKLVRLAREAGIGASIVGETTKSEAKEIRISSQFLNGGILTSKQGS